MKLLTSFFLMGCILCSAFGLSSAQSTGDDLAPASHRARPEPTIPQVHRNISKIPVESPAAAQSSSESERHLVTHIEAPVVHAGGRAFFPPTIKCADAIQKALNSEALVPAPDDKCADMMEEALDLRLRTGR